MYNLPYRIKILFTICIAFKHFFCGNQLQRFAKVHLGLFACSPRKAAGYFATIPMPLNCSTLLNFCNTHFGHSPIKLFNTREPLLRNTCASGDEKKY